MHLNCGFLLFIYFWFVLVHDCCCTYARDLHSPVHSCASNSCPYWSKFIPSMIVEWKGSRTLIYHAFLHLLFERGQKVLYGVVAGSFQLFKWGLHISFSFCFLSFLFLLFSNPSFFVVFLSICKGSCFAFVLLYSRTWNKTVSDCDYFFPHVLGREMGRGRKTNPAGRPRNQKRFQEEKIARGFDAVLSKHR